MSFQAYLDNIQIKTGLGPEEFRTLAEAKGFVGPTGLMVKATPIVAWLQQDFGLGRGHAMALVAVFKGKTG